MIRGNDKISIRQAMLLFISLFYSPAVRFLVNFTAKNAKQASWLAPIISFALLILFFMMMQNIYKKHNDKSLSEIICSIAGKFFGKILLVIFLLWILMYDALYVRYYSERFTSSIYPNVSMNIFIGVMLIFVAIVLYSGIQTAARMNEIIFAVITATFFLLVLLVIVKIDVKKVTPVSYLDIFPIFKASIGVTGLWAYALIIFFFSDKINNKEKIQKIGFQVSWFLLIVATVLIVSTIGTLGYTVVERLPLPFLVAVKQISVFNTLEKIESIVVTVWVLSDFIVIYVFSYAALSIIKHVFYLSDYKPLIPIFLLMLYLLTLLISKNLFELQNFSEKVAVNLNVIITYILFPIIFLIGKIRKKI